MKTNLFYRLTDCLVKGSACALLVAVAGCTSFEDESVSPPLDGADKGNIAVTFSGNLAADMPSAPDSRTAIDAADGKADVSWLETDNAGIFAATDGAVQANVRYEVIPDASNPSLCGFSVPEGGNALTFYEDARNDFYAVYPFSGTEGEGDPAAFAVSLPSVQIQRAANDKSHLGKYAVMTAEPVSKAAGDVSAVELSFRNVFSVLEVAVEYTGAASELVSAALVSSDSDLAFFKGALDITRPIPTASKTLPLEVADGSQRINLGFDENPALGEGGLSLWFVVLPGSHAVGALSIELVMTDGRTCRYDFDKAVDFVSNRYYRKRLAVGEADFKAEPDAAGCSIRDAVYTNTPITGYLWTDRKYSLLQADGTIANLPERFDGWTMASSGASTYPAGMMEPSEAGCVYVMTRATYESLHNVMTKEGWCAVTPLSNDNAAALRDDSSGNPAITVWRKSAGAGEKIAIPSAKAGWGGYTPIAPEPFGYEYSDAEVLLYQKVEIGGKTASKPMADRITNMRNGALIYNSRCKEGGHTLDFALWNIPDRFTYSEEARWQTLSYKSAFYPDPSVIEAKTAGMVYVLLKNDANYISGLEKLGWKRETSADVALPADFADHDVSDFVGDDSFSIYYNGAVNNGASDTKGAGYLVIMSKFCAAGEKVDLYDISQNVLKTKAGFQCIRPVAKNLEVVYPSAAITVTDVDASLSATVREFRIGVSLPVGTTGCMICGEDGSVDNEEWADKYYYKKTKTGLDRDFPAGFRNFDFLAVRRNSTQTTTAVQFRAEESGKVYGLVHAIYDADMTGAGWTLVSRAFTFDWNTNPFNIYELDVAAGEVYSTPLLTAATGNLLNTVTLLSRSITLDTAAAQTDVMGAMVDIRQLKSGQMLYPQNDDYALDDSNIPAGLKNMQYATSLKEYAGVAQVRADRPTIFRAAVAQGVAAGAGWVPTGGSMTVGDRAFDIYMYNYVSPNRWVSVPSGAGTASTLLFGRSLNVAGVPDAPGTLIAKSYGLRTRNVGNPSIMRLDDGSYFVNCTGPDPDGNTCFRSRDKGKTWSKVSNPEFMNFSKVFAKDGYLYELGVRNGVRGDLVIRKSADEGATWSGMETLFAGNYHGAPTPFVEHRGRLWHAMGVKNDDEMMGILMMSMPTSADPMKSDSWTVSNTLTGDKSWIANNPDHVFNQWQEGCVVKAPDNTLKIVTRIDDSRSNDIMALISVEDENTISFDPSKDFHIMPGAGKKFTILYDEPSGKYWTVSTPVFDEDRTRTHAGWYSEKILPIFLRSRLALCSSPDLKEWKMEKVVISSNNCFFHGFQYVDWIFDGDDIVAVSRTAFSENRGLPNRQHDANMLTFHRLTDFRNGGFETAAVTFDQI